MNDILSNIDFKYKDGELEILDDSTSPVTPSDETSSGWRLDITAKINNDGDLEVFDTTPYERWDEDGVLGEGTNPKWEYAVVERVVLVDNYDPKEIIFNGPRENITTVEDLRQGWVKDVPGNGLYHYQKIIIPYKNNTSSAIEKIYYERKENESVGKVYFIDIDSPGNNSYKELTSENFDEIYDTIVDKQFNNCFYYSSDTFSMYDLVKCYVLKERERLQDYFKNNCNGNCSEYSSKLNIETDILLSAILVIDDLLTKGDYFEAQRILNGLNTCSGLCKDVRNNLKGCGCGRN